MTNFEQFLHPLVEHNVAFIVIGGAAAIAHGSARYTQDLDIVCQRSTTNLDRLIAALMPLPTVSARRATGLAVSMGASYVGTRPELHTYDHHRRPRYPW